MVKAFAFLSLGMATLGCSSGDSAPAETKATDVAAVQLTPEQQAYQSGPGKDPNYDPSEAALHKGKK